MFNHTVRLTDTFIDYVKGHSLEVTFLPVVPFQLLLIPTVKHSYLTCPFQDI